jgi:hypothetical protein
MDLLHVARNDLTQSATAVLTRFEFLPIGISNIRTSAFYCLNSLFERIRRENVIGI